MQFLSSFTSHQTVNRGNKVPCGCIRGAQELPSAAYYNGCRSQRKPQLQVLKDCSLQYGESDAHPGKCNQFLWSVPKSTIASIKYHYLYSILRGSNQNELFFFYFLPVFVNYNAFRIYNHSNNSCCSRSNYPWQA